MLKSGFEIKWLVRKQARRLGLAALWVSLLLTAGCTAAGQQQMASADVVAMLSGAPDAAFARAYEPMEFSFPRDHGPHPSFQTEWWYYTGTLADEQGREYGYQLTLFRSALTPDMPPRASNLATNQVYMAHFAVTDVAGNSHQSFERLSRGAGGLAGAQGEPAFRVWLDDWRIEQPAPGSDLMQIEAATVNREGETVALDLTLRETRPPLLNGDRGLSQKGPAPGNASYYYSLIDLESSGTITVSGRTAAVTGQSWMDHEFGTRALSEDAVGWDWFSLQLEGGAALMLAQIRTREGGLLDMFESKLVTPDNEQIPLAQSDFTVEELDEWTSPRTGITYPSGWRITIPEHELTLEVTPLVRDQEMGVGYIYWEGAVAVDGAESGAPVRGRGYVELTGYGGSAGEFQR